MHLDGRIAVVTGATGGIGGALARRLVSEGARVVVAGRNAGRLAALAGALNDGRPGSALAVTTDVISDAGNARLIAATEEVFGPVDLFCANAGTLMASDPLTPDDRWDQAFETNVRAHIRAARHLLPGWLHRGDGYFVSTASAAGLTTQLGSATYAVTKHAAVAFAEWLAVTYRDRGVRVSCVCPRAVDTPMLDIPLDPAAAPRAARKRPVAIQPECVAASVVAAVRAERFLVLPHPEVLEFVRHKFADYDRWIDMLGRTV